MSLFGIVISRQFVALGILIASIQGVTIFSLALLAFFVPPEILGFVRWLESALAIGIAVISFGLPSIIFREAASASGMSAKGAALLQTLKLTAVFAISGVSLITIVAFVVSGAISQTTAWAAGLLLPICLLRAAVAFTQGAELAEKLAMPVMLLSVSYVAFLIMVTSAVGTNGWIFVRYAGELMLCILVLYLLRDYLLAGRSMAAPLSDYRLIRFGTIANIGFLLRTLVDHGPVIILKSMTISAAEVGYFGAAIVFVFGPQFCLSTIAQHMTPRLVVALDDFHDIAPVNKHIRKTLLFSALIFAGLSIFIGLVLKGLVPEYEGAFLPLCVLAVALVPRALQISYGTIYVAARRYDLASVMSAAELAFIYLVTMGRLGDSAISMAFVVLFSALIGVAVGEVISRRVNITIR